MDEIAFARAFRLQGLGLYPLVPTGNGFCMLVRRACLDEVGLLDAEAFPRGYGEENDFCMRAGRAGWRHVIDDCTYVFHDRSKSFGEAKTDLMAAGRAVVDARYPDYKKAIGVFGTSPEINLARFRARQALRYCGERAASLPRALYVVSTQTGGTPQTNLDLMGALDDVVDGWLLRCDSRVIELSHVRRGEASVLRRHELGEPVDAISHHSAEYDLVLEDWLASSTPTWSISATWAGTACPCPGSRRSWGRPSSSPSTISTPSARPPSSWTRPRPSAEASARRPPASTASPSSGRRTACPP